jgi:transcriptional regulator with XRE-family HTH domain
VKNNNLRHIRENKGYSQKYIAKRLGKSQAAISKIENGHIHLCEDAIEKLCKILEVSNEEIFDWKIETSKSLNDIISDLFNQFTENKKLLYQVELNQKRLQQQLDFLLSMLIKETA